MGEGGGEGASNYVLNCRRVSCARGEGSPGYLTDNCPQLFPGSCSPHSFIKCSSIAIQELNLSYEYCVSGPEFFGLAVAFLAIVHEKSFNFRHV